MNYDDDNLSSGKKLIKQIHQVPIESNKKSRENIYDDEENLGDKSLDNNENIKLLRTRGS